MIINTSELISNSKERLEIYLKDMKEYFLIYLKNEHKIVENKSGNCIPFIQTGIIIYESKLITHFIVPTPHIIKNIQPNAYSYKVLVLNRVSGFFDTLYEGTESKCQEYVLRFQEQKYGFSWKERTNALLWLNNTQKLVDELLLIIDNKEFEEYYKNKVEALHQEARDELGIKIN